MKTFGNYLLELIKVITLGGVLVWLISCDQTTKRIRLLQQYQDSIGITKLQLWYIDRQRDSLFRVHGAYTSNYYTNMQAIIKSQANYDLNHNQIKRMEDLNRYKRIVDSLKYTLK